MPIVVDALGRIVFVAALITIAAAIAICFLAPPASHRAGRMMFSWILSPLGRGLSLAGAIVAALGVAWLKGCAAGMAAWEEKRQAAREKAIQQSTEIQHDVQTDSDAALDRRLDRWMRDRSAHP